VVAPLQGYGLQAELSDSARCQPARVRAEQYNATQVSDVTETYGNLVLIATICVVVFWVFMALRPAQAQSVIPNGEYPLEIPPGLLSKSIPPGMTICFCLQQRPGGSPLHEKSDGSLYQEKPDGSLYMKMAHCKIETAVPTCLGLPDRENALSVISEMQRRTPSRLIMREGNNASLE
jgi:hypothetical protein